MLFERMFHARIRKDYENWVFKSESVCLSEWLDEKLFDCVCIVILKCCDFVSFFRLSKSTKNCNVMAECLDETEIIEETFFEGDDQEVWSLLP